MKVICFGDSNTYGYDPRGYFGGRYDADSRWVDILSVETGWTVCNMGQNGREIPSAVPDKIAGCYNLWISICLYPYGTKESHKKECQ